MKPYISVVAASRNDDHGERLLERMQVFLDSLGEQAESFCLPMEVIIVEWNPLPDKPPLSQVLKCAGGEHIVYRFITVPPDVHRTMENPDRIPFYQMAAKNVGIRRAHGEFILATCVDLIFSNEMIAFWAGRTLGPGRFYRANRHDLSEESVPGETIAERLEFCEEHIQRVNSTRPNFGTAKILHSGACGDFTMLHRDDWSKSRAYPEIPYFSYHMDTLFLFIADAVGLEEEVLEYPFYHIAHDRMATRWGGGENGRIVQMRQEFGNVLSGGQVREWATMIKQDQWPFPRNGEEWGWSEMTFPEMRYGQLDQEDFANLTLFAIPKPMIGDNARMQRNAILSWTQLCPMPRIVVMGDEEGIEEFAEEIGAEYIPKIDRNEHGTHLLSDILAKMGQASTDYVSLVNSDIILLDSFMRAFLGSCSVITQFLMVGKRITYRVDDVIDFSQEWAPALLGRAKKGGRLDPAGAIDYFVFRKGLYENVPPFAYGRTAWDNWMIGHIANDPIIDASSVVTVIHQEHGYGKEGNQGKSFIFQGPEAAENRRLAAGSKLHSCNHATWLMTDDFRPVNKKRSRLVVLENGTQVIRKGRRGYTRDYPLMPTKSVRSKDRGKKPATMPIDV